MAVGIVIDFMCNKVYSVFMRTVTGFHRADSSPKRDT